MRINLSALNKAASTTSMTCLFTSHYPLLSGSHAYVKLWSLFIINYKTLIYVKTTPPDKSCLSHCLIFFHTWINRFLNFIHIVFTLIVFFLNEQTFGWRMFRIDSVITNWLSRDFTSLIFRSLEPKDYIL